MLITELLATPCILRPARWSRPHPGPEGFSQGLMSVASLWLIPLTNAHAEGPVGAAGQVLVQLLLNGRVHLVEGKTEKRGPQDVMVCCVLWKCRGPHCNGGAQAVRWYPVRYRVLVAAASSGFTCVFPLLH